MTTSKTAILKKLGEVLNTITDGEYGAPIIKTKKDGFRCDTLCWDGPSEWVVCASGTSIFGPSFGRYSAPVQPEIQKVLDLAEENGYYFEPENYSQLCLAD